MAGAKSSRKSSFVPNRGFSDKVDFRHFCADNRAAIEYSLPTHRLSRICPPTRRLPQGEIA
jgi:hypothetical protein